ncbi:unnamed protein product [Anisakis simplex]|uniref:Syntaxin-18 (inferred by orthology to a human protein) n=1 Tax=Anisakis simplex TaxID=6269 RepID=A0A0M3JND0_ANISI|nr:unnamed protein product [Anisakis simplex]
MGTSEKHVGGYKLIASDQDEKPAELDIVEHLTEKENVQLMAENEKLYSKLAQVDSDVLRIEKQMNQIHRLQETFAEKVFEFFEFYGILTMV